MKTVVFKNRDRFQYLPGNASIFLDRSSEDPIFAQQIKPGTEAWDYAGNFLGECIDIIDNDPDSDIFGMTSNEMALEIRKLRNILRKK